MTHTDLGFLEKAEALMEKVRNEQAENISKKYNIQHKKQKEQE